MHSKWDALRGNTGFFITMSISLVVIAICGYFLLLDRDDSSAQPPVTETQDTIVTAPAPEIQVPVLSEVREESPAPVSMPTEEVSAPIREIVIDDTPVVAEAPRLIVSPLDGDVVTAFSVDSLVYNPTLEDWRIHDGVDISAALGSSVLAAASGTVIAVENDPLMGTAVTLSHEDGYHTTYANLQPEVTVRAGDAVSAGQIIGAVGESAAAEASQTPHLHFSVTQHGDAVNPEDYLAS